MIANLVTTKNKRFIIYSEEENLNYLMTASKSSKKIMSGETSKYNVTFYGVAGIYKHESLNYIGVLTDKSIWPIIQMKNKTIVY